MPSVLPFRKPAASEPINYGEAWRHGCDYGQRCANVRIFWFGVAAGLVIATAIVLATLNYSGALA